MTTAPRRINVVFLIDYFHNTGGTEKHLVQLVHGLPRESFNCSIVVFDLGPNPLLDQVRGSGIPVIHVPVGREYSLDALIRGRQLFRLFATLQPDIVQTYHQKSDSYGAIIARLSGVKHLVSSKRDTGVGRSSRHFFVNRRLRSLFEKVIVVADAVAASVIATDNIDPARIVKIHNGVDTHRVAPPTPVQAAQCRKRFGFKDDDFVAGIVARFRPEKGHDVLFNAASQAVEAIPSLKILAVGGGPLLEHYRQVCATGPLASRVTFTGDTTDVLPYLSAMDVGCLVSSEEGFSNAIVEKMAVGLPVVATTVGGNAEAVVHGDNGLLIPTNDAAALREALVMLYKDQHRRKAMGLRSRQLAEERFSVEAMCGAHARLYQSLCDAV